VQFVASAIGILAVGFLGLVAGAVLAEACVLVPFWRAQPAAAFLAWYRQNATTLLRFFGPLEAVSGVLTLGAMVLAWLGRLPGPLLFSAAAALTVAVLASFPLYFRNANARFEAGSIALTEVAAELERWAGWHWVRTAAAIAAFLFGLLALSA
jgi:hypothetical protein